MFTKVDVNRLQSRAGSVRRAIGCYESLSAHRDDTGQGLAELAVLADVVSTLCGYVDQLRQDHDDLKHGVITRG